MKVDMKRYRIGDFARKLGVTPDFLKYCEKHGDLSPQTEENGYRYYGFTQSARVIEYIRLKNQGLSAREITEALHESSFEEGVRRMRARRAQLERQIAFDEALIAFAERLGDMEFSEPPVWQLRRVDGFYFLPHSVDMEFLESEAVEACVRAWNPYMPIVMSTKRLPRAGDRQLLGEGQGLIWGFSVNETFARRVGLPVDSPAEYVPPHRSLELMQVRSLSQRSLAYLDDVYDILARNRLRICGDAHCRIITKIWEGEDRLEYSLLDVPVEG